MAVTAAARPRELQHALMDALAVHLFLVVSTVCGGAALLVGGGREDDSSD